MDTSWIKNLTPCIADARQRDTNVVADAER